MIVRSAGGVQRAVALADDRADVGLEAIGDFGSDQLGAMFGAEDDVIVQTGVS